MRKYRGSRSISVISGEGASVKTAFVFSKKYVTYEYDMWDVAKREFIDYCIVNAGKYDFLPEYYYHDNKIGFVMMKYYENERKELEINIGKINFLLDVISNAIVEAKSTNEAEDLLKSLVVNTIHEKPVMFCVEFMKSIYESQGIIAVSDYRDDNVFIVNGQVLLLDPFINANKYSPAKSAMDEFDSKEEEMSASALLKLYDEWHNDD